ncbi:hypothetical protein [Streptomyces sedi]|uniref:HEAT repeat domain-containing protein n=1 Tax=Streptomyces sedi TaxID=555059 RepID=A0A5C4VC90_9ACTN|nr:hypothetical protein [Streptomyces sedi]TNM33513.1 hypothetical protein FH715_03930 [Streptomyces sedi]
MTGTRHLSRRVVLRDHVTVEELSALAATRNWATRGAIPRNRDEGIFFEKIWDVSEETRVHYVVDDFLGERYLLVSGPQEPSGAELQELTTGIDQWSVDEAALAFDGSVYVPEQERTTFLLGAVAHPAAGEAVSARLVRASESAHPSVRRVAVWAMAYGQDPVCRDTLTNFLARETGQELRQEAEEILRQFTD